jgi:hypothetical protein
MIKHEAKRPHTSLTSGSRVNNLDDLVVLASSPYMGNFQTKGLN